MDTMDPHALFAAWQNFYVIVGSAAAALTGLQFVVIALITDTQTRSGHREIAAFGTPTIVHFCVALAVSAVLSAPWPREPAAALALGACGLFGLGYSLIVARRATRTTAYQPVAEDWIWHVGLPLLSYLALLAGAITLAWLGVDVLFGIAGAALLLLFIGIHNAWDTVTYVALDLPRRRALEASDGNTGSTLIERQ